MKKILLVEDHHRYGNSIESALRWFNYDVRWETRGFHLIPKALDFKPDLIILDVFFNLTDNANGEDVAAEIRANPSLQNIPIIVLTAYMTDDDIRNANNHYQGAQKHYFPKTENPYVILEKIKEFVEMEHFLVTPDLP